MSELMKAAITFAAELLGDVVYEKSLTKHDVAQITHHKLLAVFLNNIHNPSIMYAFTPLNLGAATAGADKFLTASSTVPVRLADTADGWLVVGAARKPLTLREEFHVKINFDRAPHV